MKVLDIYRNAVEMTSTAAEKAMIAAFRGVFGMEFARQEREDEALAALRALGDDGTHLRQAVMLAVVCATDEQVETFAHQLAAHWKDKK